MLQSYWFLVVGLGAAATYFWAFKPETRVPLSTSLASTAWALASLSGGSLVKRTQCCETAVAVAFEIRLVLAAMAILSLLALLLYLAGSYPPEQAQVPDARGG